MIIIIPFVDWLVDMECYFDCYVMIARRKFQFANWKFLLLEIVRKVRNRRPIDLWEEMKDGLIKYLLLCDRNRLTNKMERWFTQNVWTQWSKCEGYRQSVSHCTSIKCFNRSKFWQYDWMPLKELNPWIPTNLVDIWELLRVFLLLRIVLVSLMILHS